MNIKGIDKKEYYKQYYKNNKNKYNKDTEYNSKWKKANPEYFSQWYQENKQSVRKRESEYRKQRKLKDSLFKLKMDIRALVGMSFNRVSKTNTTEKILGCTFEQLKGHLESQFESWMSWDNRASKTVDGPNTSWDVDHIIPLSTAKNKNDIIRLNHYTNLRPLCAYNNRYVKRDN
jgi:hypothetical protein